MSYYLLALALASHACFWGAGLAWGLSPRCWRPVWWAWAPLAGLALQSSVVWFGAVCGLRGTETYAWWSELIPLALLGWASRKRGVPSLNSLASFARSSVWPLVLLMGLTGWFYLSPMASSSGALIATSLGSCDHADYAAGARLFQEFGRDDQIGFLSQTEVSGVGSASTFFEFFLRLNHFTPSALLAHNGAIFGCQAHQLVSITAAVLVVLNMSLVWLLARVEVGWRGLAGLGVALLYGVSPLCAYAVHQGALGQLYGTMGILGLTLGATGAGRAAFAQRSTWPWAPLVLAACWLLAGSYNFILTVALAPACGWVGLQVVTRREWRPAVRLLAMIGTMLVVCAILFWGRFDGLIERFRLFEQFDFGWPVPLLTPEGWVGLVSDVQLRGHQTWLRWLLGALVVAGAAITIFVRWGRERRAALTALALALPVSVGWAMLADEAQTRPNASYDAYKLVAVFLPVLLIGLLGWIRVGFESAGKLRWLTVGCFVVLLTVNLQRANEFRGRMESPPLRVDRDLAALGRLETMTSVGSINMLIDDYWSRLWANYFLLRKQQYFAIHTYEGRLNTPLRGEWDLSDSPLRVRIAANGDSPILAGRFHLSPAATRRQVEAGFGTGWYGAEHLGASAWRWSSGESSIRVQNHTAETLKMSLAVVLQGVTAGRVDLEFAGKQLGTELVGPEPRRIDLGEIEIPLGSSEFTVRPQFAALAPAGDTRPLAFALHAFTLVQRP